MAKKKKKTGKRRRIETLPEVPAAKRESRRPDEDVETAPDTSQSLPPTKKSNLPPELAHDDREIDARNITRFTVILGAFVALTMLATWYLDRLFTSSERAGHTPPLPMATTLPTGPPEPRLRRLPTLGLADFKGKEQQELETYGWVDPAEGIVRIPIERAMVLTVERGLPARERPTDAGPHVSQPSDSSLDAPGGLR